MRKGGVVSIVLLFSALVVTGCAKKEMVKAEEPLAPSASVKGAEPETKPAIKEEPVREQPIKEAAVREEPPIQAAPATPAAEKALEPVYFDFDSYVLIQPTRDILYRNAEWLLKNRGAKVQIEGHCDERGSDEYNLALGEKRAKSAFNYLVTVGVPAERLSIISYGEEKPGDPGHDEAAWAKNRRAEFSIVSK